MWSGWAAGRSFLWWMVDAVSPAVRFRAGGSGGGVGRLAEVGIDEGWRIERIPGSWMSHQRCAGWLGGKAEFPCGLPGGCERRRVAGRL